MYRARSTTISLTPDPKGGKRALVSVKRARTYLKQNVRQIARQEWQRPWRRSDIDFPIESLVCHQPQKLALKLDSSSFIDITVSLSLCTILSPKHKLGAPGISVFLDNHHASRSSDFTIYSVKVDRVVAEHGPYQTASISRQ